MPTSSLPFSTPGLLRADWVAAAVLLLTAFAVRAVWFGDPVADFDDQLYSFIGWRMTQGDWPYVDQWDRKPFGLFAMFALAHWIGGPGAAAYQVMATLSVFVGSLFVYALSRLLVDRFSAAVAGVLYVMMISIYGSWGGQSETLHTPLTLAMLWLVRDWRRPDATKRALAAMLVGGLALQIKYTVLPQCLFLGAYALWGQWRAGASLTRLAALAAGFAALGLLPTALVTLLYAAIGQFDAYWYANFVSFFERMPAYGGRFGNVGATVLLPLGALVAVGLVAGLTVNRPADRGTWGLYLGFLLATAATVYLPSTVYMYYYSAFAGAAALAALPLIAWRKPLAAIALLLGGTYLLQVPHRLWVTEVNRASMARLTQAIRPHVDGANNCLYVFDGPTVLYRTTGSCLPTKFVYPDHLNNDLERHSLGVDQVAELRRILATRPSMIVSADRYMTPQRPENLAQVQHLTAEAYRPITVQWLQGRRITAWLRNDLAQVSPPSADR